MIDVHFRVLPETAAELDRRARALGVTRSAYLRSLVAFRLLAEDRAPEAPTTFVIAPYMDPPSEFRPGIDRLLTGEIVSVEKPKGLRARIRRIRSRGSRTRRSATPVGLD